jgi:hypothetical protein
MELKVEEIKSLAPVKFNYEDIKKWVTEKSSEYKSIVYTPETITLAKQDRATLNKVSEAINNEKKRIKNELLKPYVDFENKCKELMAIVDDASKTIDKQVKEFEEKEQNAKKEQIKAVFDAYIGNYKDLIIFDSIFNSRWLNKTYTMKKIEEEINHLVVKTSDDMKVLKGQINDEVILKQVQAFYFSHIADPDCLSGSLKYGMNVIESNRKLEELKQQQESKKEVQSPNIVQPASTQEQLQVIDFRVWVTQEQKMKIRDFLIQNNIKYGKVD